MRHLAAMICSRMDRPSPDSCRGDTLGETLTGRALELSHSRSIASHSCGCRPARFQWVDRFVTPSAAFRRHAPRPSHPGGSAGRHSAIPPLCHLRSGLIFGIVGLPRDNGFYAAAVRFALILNHRNVCAPSCPQCFRHLGFDRIASGRLNPRVG